MNNAFVTAVEEASASCPDCGAHTLLDRGRIPSASEFAGQPLDQAFHATPPGRGLCRDHFVAVVRKSA